MPFSSDYLHANTHTYTYFVSSSIVQNSLKHEISILNTYWRIIMWCARMATCRKSISIVFMLKSICTNTQNATFESIKFLIRTVLCIVHKIRIILSPFLHASMCIYLHHACCLQRFIYCFLMHVSFGVFQEKTTMYWPLSKGWLIFRIFEQKKKEKDVLALMSCKMNSDENGICICDWCSCLRSKSNTMSFYAHFER